MTREEKVLVVEEFVGIFTKPGIYLMDFKGLNVTEITELRRKLHEASISMRVVKNSLAKRALKEVSIDCLDNFFVGPTGVIWSSEDSVIPARVLLEFVKKHEKGIIKAGIIDGTFVNEDEIKSISKLPTKSGLQAKLASTLNAPVVKLHRVLNEIPVKFVRTVDALREKKSEEAA